MTELKSALMREVKIANTAYRLTISPEGFKLVLKGKRNGLQIAWRELINGDAAMAVALRASLTAPVSASDASPKTNSGRSAKQKLKKRPEPLRA